MFKKTILSLSLCLIASMAINAQQLGLYFLDGLIQANHLNPAFAPTQKVAYSFPGLNAGFSNSMGAYNDFVTVNSEGVGVLNGDVLLQQLSDNNFVRGGFDLHTYHSVIGKKNWRIILSNTIKFDTYVNIPRDLFSLGLEGNAAAVGETFNIGRDLNMSAYSETGLGFMWKFGEVSVGGKIKLLSGIANVSTDKTTASVTTDEEYYQLDAMTDYRINAAGLVDIKNPDDLSQFDMDWKLDEFSVSDMFNNLSVGLDLGGSVKLMDKKLTLSASVIDIGKVKWKNPYNFHSKGAYTFEGIDARDLVEDDELTFEGTLDTLDRIFNFTESNNLYSTALPAKAYFSGHYKIHPFFSAGGMLYYENYRGQNFGGYAVNASTHMGEIVNLGLTWSSVYKTNSLGAHFVLKLGPVQLVALTDNIMAALKPYDNQNFNAQFGLNLVFK